MLDSLSFPPPTAPQPSPAQRSGTATSAVDQLTNSSSTLTHSAASSTTGVGRTRAALVAREDAHAATSTAVAPKGDTIAPRSPQARPNLHDAAAKFGPNAASAHPGATTQATSGGVTPMEQSDSSKQGSWLNSAGDFTRGLGEGAWDGASGMVQGVGDLAKGAYHLATSANARSHAADTISKGATAAGQFAKTAMTDPAKAAGQVGLAAGDAVNNVSTAYHHAAANGHGAEFIGKIVGQGAVVAATLPVGGAEAEGAAAVGDVGRMAEAAGDLGKTGDAAAHASKALNVTDAASSNVVAHASNAATTEQVATGSDSAVTQLAAASKAAKPTSTGATFADEKKLASHFQAHGKDFGSSSAADYESKANKFLTSTKSADTLEKLRVNGDKVRFNPNTDEFGVISKSGVIRTYYKPEPTTHGYATNMAYFNAQ